MMQATWRKATFLILHFLLYGAGSVAGELASVTAAWAAAPDAVERAPVLYRAEVDRTAGIRRPVLPSILQREVDAVIAPILSQYNVAGAAVGVSVDGRHQFFNYGLASRETDRPVSERTLFEIGSVSKTFAAAVAAEAVARGGFKWDQAVSAVVPALRGSAFDTIPMWQLGTHTSGLPLPVPNAVQTQAQLMDYLKRWSPPGDAVEASPAGTRYHRVYSNVGIGLLGWAAAQTRHRDYAALVQQEMLPALGMRNTFLSVPSSRMADYAQGYTQADQPIRVHLGVLAAEAYGIKSSSADLLQYLDAQIDAARSASNGMQGTKPSTAPSTSTSTSAQASRHAWLSALAATQQPWVRAGTLTQDLMWEQYGYPTSLADLQAGNDVALTRLPATLLPRGAHSKASLAGQPEEDAVLINKTGSTNGFGAYLVFVPQRRIGIVMLFNKAVPIAERVAVAAHILSTLDANGIVP